MAKTKSKAKGQATKAKSKRVVKTPKVAKEKLKVYDMLILDTSGSMKAKSGAVIEGFNKHVDGLVKMEEKTKVETLASLIYFDEARNIKFKDKNCRPSQIERLHHFNYIPDGGGTALYDAIGYGILEMQKLLEGDTEKLTKKDVTITILTDGGENASRIYCGSNVNRLRDLIKEAKNLNWTIVLLGAGDDHYVRSVARDLGIEDSNTMAFTNDSVGTETVFTSYSDARMRKTSNFSTTGVSSNVGFFQE
jgi:hypothetical protein